VVAAAQMLLVASVGAKFTLDRSNLPRVWAQTAPIDPDLPIRGRYVQLGVLVEPERGATSEASDFFTARLEVRGDELVAVEDEHGKHHVESVPCGSKTCWRLSEPVAYFIPEDAEDPSRRAAGEELWVEVSVPRKGAPRPIQLGVKKSGAPAPLPWR
jgi:uncharacterized membrane-anchored protein